MATAGEGADANTMWKYEGRDGAGRGGPDATRRDGKGEDFTGRDGTGRGGAMRHRWPRPATTGAAAKTANQAQAKAKASATNKHWRRRKAIYANE